MLGLTFKPDTDDMRESPSVAIITALQDAGAKVRAYDPQGMGHARTILTTIAYAEDAYACAQGADALVIMTEWEVFRALDLPRIKALIKRPIIVDLRNIYRPEEVVRHGFTYVSVGRPALRQQPAGAA